MAAAGNAAANPPSIAHNLYREIETLKARQQEIHSFNQVCISNHPDGYPYTYRAFIGNI